MKEERLKSSKRKIELADVQPKKQIKLTQCVNTKYDLADPRQKKNTNAIGSMICVDGTATNIVKWPGFKHHGPAILITGAIYILTVHYTKTKEQCR